jgi:hypothetical protein
MANTVIPTQTAKHDIHFRLSEQFITQAYIKQYHLQPRPTKRKINIIK